MKKYSRYIFAALLGLVSVQFVASAANDGDNTDYVKLFKKTVKVEKDSLGNKVDDLYRITLDSYVTGSTTFTELTKPVDLMLVLDVSTSMAANCQGKPADWTLKTFEKLTTGDKINSVLHTNTSGDSNYSAVEGNTLRYRIKLSNSNTVRNLLYYDGAWHYDNDGTHTSRWNGTWNTYDRNNVNDIIYTDVKIDLLQEACRVFLDELRVQMLGKDGERGTEDDVDIRVGISTFCGQLMTNNNYNIVPINVDANYNALINKINNLHNNMGGSTDPSLSFDDIKNNKYPTLTTALTGEGKTADEIAERSKVVVMFTDGKPQDGAHGGDLNYLINSAHNLKSTFGAKLYTIGIFDDPGATIKNGVTINQYMSYLSSEYPDATGYSQDKLGNRNTDGIQYYYSDTGAKLSEIFQSIAQSAGADTYQVSATDAAAIDVMSSDFELPDGCSAADITMTMWVCVATSEAPDGDELDSDGKIIKKIRDHYEFVPYKVETTDTDKIYDKDKPEAIVHAATSASDKDRVIVNGFWYSKDDDLKKDGNGNLVLKNGKPQIADNGTYGNWVGVHQDGNVRGKMLSFSFDVKLKESSMGGYGLPSNESTSGIYLVKTDEDGKIVLDENGLPIMEELVTLYPEPVVDVPSIIIIKEGLKYGDSAIFTVTRTKDASGNSLKDDDDDYMKYTVILTQDDESANNLCYVVIKDLKAGTYEVEENTLWAWTYTPDLAYSTDGTGAKIIQSRKLSQPVIPDGMTMDTFKATVRGAQTGGDYGKTTVDGWDTEAKRYYVMGNALHLMFRFNNNPVESSLSLHDEAVAVNVFGNGGGSAEWGGSDPEVEL